MGAPCLLICVAILSVICRHHAIADVPPHAKDKDEERWEEADECFSNAVAKVEMRCKDMTEDEQFFLQFDFMNCYLRMMGMNSVVCEERTRQACSALLNRPEHKLQDNIFEKFYNDLPALCYHAANALWRKQTRSQVHSLQNLSDETVRGLLESLQLQEVLEQQQKQILDNQERMLQQGQEISDAVSQQHKAMNRSFSHLHGNLTEQASVLQVFGNQLQSSLDRIHSVLVFVVGEVTGGVEAYVLLVCVLAMVRCLSATRQAQCILHRTVLWIVAEVTVEMVLRVFLRKETLVVVVSVVRQLFVCAALLVYLVQLVRRLLRPQVEDYDTELLIGHLSHQVEDMEARLQASGLLPPEPVTSHPPPLLSSSPRLITESALPNNGTWDKEFPLPQPRDTSGPSIAPIYFREESGITYDGGYDEVDAGMRSVTGLTREERHEREGGQSQCSVADNKLAEKEEAVSRNGTEAKRKDSSRSKKRGSKPRAPKRAPTTPPANSSLAEDDTSIWPVSQRHYNLRTRRPLRYSPVRGSPQPSHHRDKTVDELVSDSHSDNRLNRSQLAAREAKSGGADMSSTEPKRRSGTARSTSTSSRRHKARRSML